MFCFGAVVFQVAVASIVRCSRLYLTEQAQHRILDEVTANSDSHDDISMEHLRVCQLLVRMVGFIVGWLIIELISHYVVLIHSHAHKRF